MDHFESLMAEVSSYASGDTPTLLSLDAVSFLRASLCSSNGAFKPTRNALRRVYNQIAMVGDNFLLVAFVLMKECRKLPMSYIYIIYWLSPLLRRITV